MIPLKHPSEKKKPSSRKSDRKQTNQNHKQSQAKYEWKIGSCKGI